MKVHIMSYPKIIQVENNQPYLFSARSGGLLAGIRTIVNNVAEQVSQVRLELRLSSLRILPKTL